MPGVFAQKRKGVTVLRILTTTVSTEEDGWKLRTLLRNRWHISSSLLKSMKWRDGAIAVNGSSVPVSTVLRQGDEVTVDVSDDGSLSEHIIPVDYPLDILWEDEDLLILNKPAGLAVHSAALTEETVTVAGAVAHYLGGAPFHPVNRLDRGVTGVMVVAKSGFIHHRCMAILHTDDFRREYRGICDGVPKPTEGMIDLSIGREPDSVLKRCIDANGLPARTEFEVLGAFGDRALLRLRPLTGRTHQLRLHCAAIGHPLLGDWLYGTEDRALIPRPALHSYELWLRHPLTEEIIHVAAPLPEDMKRLLP
ncbi:MAG: RluA family pseudouridine synthase [Oscillospiraceae bacterium]|nr:RluA family pseudouridine synthase [Oscillospiraceae bacterium]